MRTLIILFSVFLYIMQVFVVSVFASDLRTLRNGISEDLQVSGVGVEIVWADSMWKFLVLQRVWQRCFFYTTRCEGKQTLRV